MPLDHLMDVALFVWKDVVVRLFAAGGSRLEMSLRDGQPEGDGSMVLPPVPDLETLWTPRGEEGEENRSSPSTPTLSRPLS